MQGCIKLLNYIISNNEWLENKYTETQKETFLCVIKVSLLLEKHCLLIFSLPKLHVGVCGSQFPKIKTVEVWQVDEIDPDRENPESHEKVATVFTA